MGGRQCQAVRDEHFVHFLEATVNRVVETRSGFPGIDYTDDLELPAAHGQTSADAILAR